MSSLLRYFTTAGYHRSMIIKADAIVATSKFRVSGQRAPLLSEVELKVTINRNQQSMTCISQLDLVRFLNDAHRGATALPPHILTSIYESPVMELSTDSKTWYVLRLTDTALKGLRMMYMHRLGGLPIVDTHMAVIGNIYLYRSFGHHRHYGTHATQPYDDVREVVRLPSKCA
jgi:hypothetical protein